MALNGLFQYFISLELGTDPAVSCDMVEKLIVYRSFILSRLLGPFFVWWMALFVFVASAVDIFNLIQSYNHCKMKVSSIAAS